MPVIAHCQGDLHYNFDGRPGAIGKIKVFQAF
jgi:hypothetical protein